ncbi:MAG: transporter [Flavobacteriales bacterium]|nr:transporter [Flavobacteriales bacterium]
MWEVFSSFILRQRYLILLVLAVITGFLYIQSRKIQMSYEMSQVLPATDSTMMSFVDFTEKFGQDGSVMVIGLPTDSLTDLAHFNAWMSLSQRLQKVEGIDNVMSIADIFGLERNREKKSFDTYKIFKQLPKDQVELDSLLEEAFDLPFYEGFIYSEDHEATLMAITVDRELLDSKDRGVLMGDLLNEITRFEEETGMRVYKSGLPFIRTNNTTKVSQEIQLFILLAVLVTATILLLFFRSFKAMFFSMIVVLIGVVWSLGIQGIFEYKITILTALIPPLIIVIGIPNCIFILNKYHQEYKKHGNQILALRRVIMKIGNAIFLTNMTTSLGFGTFVFTDSEILIEFGIVAVCGIASVFIVSITLLPIIQSFLAPPRERHTKHLERKWVQIVVDQLVHMVTNHRRLVYVTTIVILILSFYGITLMKTTGNIADDLPRDGLVYQDLLYFEDNFKGVLPLEVTIDAKKKGGATKYSTLRRIDRLQDLIEEYPEFSKPLSIVEGLKFAKQGYYGGNPSKYSLYNPQERSFIAPYLLGSDQESELLESYLDTGRQVTRLTAQMADVGSNRMEEILADLQPKVDSIFPADKYDVQFTGSSVVWLKGTDYLVKNLFLSLSIAIVLIAIIMAVLFSSLRMVFVSLIPNLIPLLFTAAIMGYFGISIKPSTILIFSIAFGISVDDTIHYLAKYRQELHRHSLNLREAAILALRETGVSMIYTSIVLFFGFGVFTASEFGGTVALGLLVSVTLLVAMASNLILLPSLILSFDKWLTTKVFKEEALIEILDEEEDIEIENLTVKELNSKTEKTEENL